MRNAEALPDGSECSFLSVGAGAESKKQFAADRPRAAFHQTEDSIYRDLRMEDTGMDEIENSAGEKLRSFPALSRDIF